MSEHSAPAQGHGHDAGHDDGLAHAHHPDYVKIWAVLLVLLLISVAGPFLGIQIVTLLTAFGIAIVKAFLVVKNFMHIDIASKYVAYFVVTALVFMFLFFAGAAPDVMEAKGRNWEKPTWVSGTAHPPAAGGHEEGHH